MCVENEKTKVQILQLSPRTPLCEEKLRRRCAGVKGRSGAMSFFIHHRLLTQERTHTHTHTSSARGLLGPTGVKVLWSLAESSLSGRCVALLLCTEILSLVQPILGSFEYK